MKASNLKFIHLNSISSYRNDNGDHTIITTPPGAV